MKTFKFLSTHIREDLTWTHNTRQIIKESQQRLFFSRKLRKFGLTPNLLSTFYRCTVKSMLTKSITVWYGTSTTQDRKALQHVFKTSVEYPPHPPTAHTVHTPAIWQTLQSVKPGTIHRPSGY